MKLITKKSKAILSTCIAISIAGGAVFADNILPSPSSKTGNANIIIDTGSNKSSTDAINTAAKKNLIDSTTGASVLVSNRDAMKTNDKGESVPKKAKVVVFNERTDIGLETTASPTGTAVGAYASAKGKYSNAFGYSATVEKGADNSTSIGTNAKVISTATNAVAIGANSIATKTDEVSFGDGASNIYRTLTNVADGNITADSHDAATGGQLYLEQQARFAADAVLSQEIDNVGALSAALAGLHPLDYDGTGSKFQLATAMGNYDGKKAVALGGFYNANKNVLLSFAASRSFNNHKTAANVGATFRIGAGSTQSVPTAANDALLQKVNALANDVSSLKQENEELKAQLAALQK